MVFLSHSWKEKPIARKVVEALCQNQVPVWLDEQQLDVGASLRSALLQAVAKSSVYVYLVSRAANDSIWVQDELRHAIGLEIEKGLRIIPVRLVNDESPLPDLLVGRLYHFLDPNRDGVGRLAADIKSIPGAQLLSNESRVSATARLSHLRLIHTLREVRHIARGRETNILFLDGAYGNLSSKYWGGVAEVEFPKVDGNQGAYLSAVSIMEDIHRQSKAAIAEAQRIALEYLQLSPTSDWLAYHENLLLGALHVLLYRLDWNTNYLVRLGKSETLDATFVEARQFPSPIEEHHRCDFISDQRAIGSAGVPKHGNPYDFSDKLAPWGLTSPFNDLLEDEVGQIVGNLLAQHFLAGNLSGVEAPNPATLSYGLS